MEQKASDQSYSVIKFIFTGILKIFIVLAAIYTGGITEIGTPSAIARQANEKEVKSFLQEKGWLQLIWRIAEVGIAFAFGILLFVYTVDWIQAVQFHDLRNIIFLPLPLLALGFGIVVYLAITDKLIDFTFIRLGIDVLTMIGSYLVLGYL